MRARVTNAQLTEYLRKLANNELQDARAYARIGKVQRFYEGKAQGLFAAADLIENLIIDDLLDEVPATEGKSK